MTGERRSIGESIPSTWIRDFIQQYVDSSREGHRFAQESQQHGDRMLTWAIGLMGAGIFSSAAFLGAATPRLRFAALLPWIAGIVLAVAGRLIAAELMGADRLAHFDRVNRLQALLLLDEERIVRSRIDLILAGGEGLKEKAAAVRRQLRWFQRCFYGVHILLALGIVAVVATAYCAAQ
jgi:hypothetical protein